MAVSHFVQAFAHVHSSSDWWSAYSGFSQFLFLLAGHGLHLGFAAGCDAFLHLASLVRQQPRPWPAASARGTWLGTVRSWLQTLKWREEGGWRWSHPNVDFVIDWSRAISDDIKSKEQHALRETWRRQQFQLFLDSGRRDATATHGSEYCESRCKIVRQTFQLSSTHMRACLIGAVVSDARFDKIIHPHADPSLCSWCDSGTVPTWHHLAWECAAFASTRCETPLDSLQRVLGWPSGQSVADGKVLAHLGSVREKILDRCWRGNYKVILPGGAVYLADYLIKHVPLERMEPMEPMRPMTGGVPFSLSFKDKGSNPTFCFAK